MNRLRKWLLRRWLARYKLVAYTDDNATAAYEAFGNLARLVQRSGALQDGRVYPARAKFLRRHRFLVRSGLVAICSGDPCR